MNKVQVKGEEQQVERKEIGDLTDTSFHNSDLLDFKKMVYSDICG